MADEAFVNFAKHRLAVGAEPKEIAATLRINGLSEEEVRDVLQTAGASTLPPQIEPTRPPSPFAAPTKSTPAEKPAQNAAAAPHRKHSLADALPIRSITEKVSLFPPKLADLPKVQPYQEKIASPTETVAYVGFWRRFLAAFADGIILALLFVGVAFMFFIVTASLSPTPTEQTIAISIASLVIIFYYPIFESSSLRGSIGKFIMDIEITTERGDRISFGRALVRNLCKLLSLVLIIGFLMIAFTKKKQGLHDMIAKTVVVRSHYSRIGTIATILILAIGLPTAAYYFKNEILQVQLQIQKGGGDLQYKNQQLQQAIQNTP